MSIQFPQYLWMLAFLPVITGLFLYLLSWKKKVFGKMGDAGLIKDLTKGFSAQRFNLKFILFSSAFAITAFSLTNPRMNNGAIQVNRNGIDVMIALDVSKSMLAKDIQPSRLERAKQMLTRLIDKLSNDRVGIVLFAGRAYLQMPLTGDHGAARMYLSSATPDAVPTQGTVIAEALKMCAASFSSKEKKYKSIILVSDGEDHDEEALMAASSMKQEGIVINTVGIGSPEGSTIMDETTHTLKKDGDGNTVISKLNEPLLRNIAEKGDGIYLLYQHTEEAVNTLYYQLSNLGQRNITEDSLVNYRSFFQWFLALVLVLLVAEFFISERNSNNRNSQKRLPRFAVFFFLFIFCKPTNLFSQNNNAGIKKGNDAYHQKEYEKAAGEYKKVLAADPTNNTAQYNLGNAQYRNQNTEEALAAYDIALANARTKAEKAGILYNKGVVLQQNKRLPECVEAYKKSLKLNPADEDTRQNLQKALQQLKQQQQQQKKDREKKQPKKDDQSKQKQKPENEQTNNQPKPQPSKLSKDDAEEKLKLLMQQEKNLQDKLRRSNMTSPNKPEKDW